MSPPPAGLVRRCSCQVEAGPLAKYVMTLLERNQELEELQESCDEKLEEFLHDNTKPFVNDLFKFIRGQMAQQRQSRYGGDEDDADDRHKRRRSREDDSGRKRRADSRERSDRRGSDRYEREDDRRGARGRG